MKSKKHKRVEGQQNDRRPLSLRTAATFQQAVNDSTATINGKRSLAMFQIGQTQDAITSLEAALRDQKRRLRELTEEVAGYTSVLSTRQIV